MNKVLVKFYLVVLFMTPNLSLANLYLPTKEELIESYLFRVRGNVESQEYGTAIAIHSEKGEVLLVTALHTLTDRNSISVFNHNGIEYPARLLFESARYDLAVVRVSENIIESNSPLDQPIPMSTMRDDFLRCDIHEELTAIGFPQGKPHLRHIESKLLATKFKGREVGAEIDGKFIEEGISGGVALNTNKELAGIITEVHSSMGIAMLVKAGYLREFLDENSVNNNLMVHNPLLGEWKLVSGSIDDIVLAPVTHQENLRLSSSGVVSGMASGRFCIRDTNKLIFEGMSAFSGARIHLKADATSDVTTPISFGNLTSCIASRAALFDFSSTSSNGAGFMLTLKCQQDAFSTSYNFSFVQVE